MCVIPCIHGHVLCVSYEEEDTCVPYLAYMVTSTYVMHSRTHMQTG